MKFGSILELGYGKEIEQIIKLLGSGQNDQGEEDDDIVPKGVQKQNLLLSATLNEKVNHLAKLSLDDPVMIGLDNSKLHQNLSVESPASPDSDADDMVIHVNKSVNPSSEDYGIPSQLVQKYVRGTFTFTRISLYCSVLLGDTNIYYMQCHVVHGLWHFFLFSRTFLKEKLLKR